MKLLGRLAPALGVEVADLVQDLSSERPGRMQLEEVLASGEVEVWYRSRKLSGRELKRVHRLVEAALEEWDEEAEQDASLQP